MSPDTPLGLVAGGGRLPQILAARLTGSGRSCLVLSLGTAAEGWMEAYPHGRVAVGDFASAFRQLREADCQEVCLAGDVQRPDPVELSAEEENRPHLARLAPMLDAGDAVLLAAIAGLFEENGFSLRGAQDLAPDLLVGTGTLAGTGPDARDLADIRRASEISAALGRAGVGQAAVVAGGRCLGLEVVDGTAGLLARVAALPASHRGSGGILYKAPAPGQDRRIDLPAIGPATIDAATAAGLRGIALEARGALLVERDDTLTRAEQAGVFLYGHEPVGSD